MLLGHLLLGLLWLGQAPKTHVSQHHHESAAAARAAVPKGPKTQAELTQDLESALHAAPFAGDHLSLAISGQAISIGGTVHMAENKGVATRVARRIAARDGHGGVHVYNHAVVVLTAQD